MKISEWLGDSLNFQLNEIIVVSLDETFLPLEISLVGQQRIKLQEQGANISLVGNYR